MLLTVRPAGIVVAMTVKVPAAVSTSFTVAIEAFVAATPCVRDSPLLAMIVGVLLTVSAALAVVTEPQPLLTKAE